MSIWWNHWSDFWAMGQHGLYVWGSYGMAAALLLAEVLQTRHARHQVLHDIVQSYRSHPTDQTTP